MDDSTLSLFLAFAWALVVVFAITGIWLVKLGSRGKWKLFLSVAALGLAVVGLFIGPPLLTAKNGILTDWDMAAMLGYGTLFGLELMLGILLGCIARFISIKRAENNVTKDFLGTGIS